MKETILDKVKDVGLDFAAYARKEDEELDEDLLREAIMTGHVTPDELGEIFSASVLENLGLEDNLETRRDDRVEKILEGIRASGALVFVAEPFHPPTRATPVQLRRFAEKIADALGGKSS